VYPLTLGLIVGTKQLWDEVQSCIQDLPVRVVFEQAECGKWDELLEKLEQTRPDLLVLDLHAISEPLAQVVARIKSMDSPPVIAALHTEATPDLILDAVRAGASEFLYPPLQESLLKTLTRVSDERQQQRGPARKGGKVLAFLSAKGGCGATTIACHMAVELSHQTRQYTLLADLDFSAGMISFLMKSRSDYSVLDALRNVHRLDLSFWKKLISNGIPNLEIITAPSALTPNQDVPPESLKAITQFARMHYDWTLMDLGRGLSEPILSQFEAVDQVFLVTTMEVPALHQTQQIVRRLLDSGLPGGNLRLIVNRMPKNPELTLGEVEKVLGYEVFASVPNDYPSLHDSYSEGRLLHENTPIRRHLAEVARRIAGIQQNKTKRKFSFFG
jgi:pilus assembly protein CpaE